MKEQTATKLAIKRSLASLPTPNWTSHYPDLNRLEKYKINALCQILLAETGHMVFSGPFSTMQLSENLELSWDPRMIVGSYEEEIHDVINNVICMAPTNIIDIGSAFGYYAVGFALKIANTLVHAFEAVEEPHWKQLRQLAELNDVSNKILQAGLCTAAELKKVCTPQSFLLCDCEGGEEEILQPIEIPALKSCNIVVELHEFNRQKLVGTLVSRFRESHNIRIVEETYRDPGRYRILRKLPSRWRSIAIEEAKWIPRESARIATWLRFMVLDPK